MAGHKPALDGDSLRRLRRLVATLHRDDGHTLPMEQLVELAGNDVGGGITIDIEGSRELGEPMVVVRGSPPPAACLDVLTPREREVSRLVTDGLGNKQIARELHIVVATVKDHIHRILEKTGLPNRAAIAAAWQGKNFEGP